MKPWSEPEREVGPPKTPGRIKHASRPQAADLVTGSTRQVRRRQPEMPKERAMVGYFQQAWDEMLAAKKDRTSLPERPLDSVGQCVTYMRAHFKDKTHQEIRRLIDQFMDGVRTSSIILKPTQTPWMAFTGHWGRHRRDGMVPSSTGKFDYEAYDRRRRQEQT